MSAPISTLPPEVQSLVEHKKLDELEDLWTRRMEESPAELEFFFAVAAAVKKKAGAEAADRALSWLRFLADYLSEN